VVAVGGVRKQFRGVWRARGTVGGARRWRSVKLVWFVANASGCRGKALFVGPEARLMGRRGQGVS